MTPQNKQKLKELVRHPCSSKEVADEMTKIIEAESTIAEKLAVFYFMTAYDSAFNPTNPFIEGYLDLKPELNEWLAYSLYDMRDSPVIDNYRQIGQEWMGEMGFPKKGIRADSRIPTLNNNGAIKTKAATNESILSKVKKDPELLLKTAKEIIESHFQLSPITKEILTLALRENIASSNSEEEAK